MTHLPVPVYLEYAPEVPFVQALLRPYAVDVRGGFSSSAAISFVKASLIENPEQPVVLLLDSDTENEKPESTRGTVKRILARAHYENWYVGLAVPNMLAWAATDPRFGQEIAPLDGQASYTRHYATQMARVSELLATQPFDASELARTVPDFRGLLEFLQKHAPAPAPLAPSTGEAAPV